MENNNFNLQSQIYPLMQNVQQVENNMQEYIKQIKLTLLEINGNKEKIIKDFKEIKETIEFEFTKKAEQELERINSKIDSVDRKIKLENLGKFNPEIEKKIRECVFIIERENAYAFELINLFSNSETQPQGLGFLRLKIELQKIIHHIEKDILYLKHYVDNAKIVPKKYENMLSLLRNVKEPFIEDEYVMDEIVKMIKKELSEALGPIFPVVSINETVSRYYAEEREGLANFLEDNSGEREGFKKYSFPYLIFM